MSDDPHQRFEELCAGFALDSLDDRDEASFRAHLASCLRCQAMVAELSAVAADLATSVAGEDPDPSLRDRILAAALAGSGPPSVATADHATPTAIGSARREHRAPINIAVLHRHSRVRRLAAAAVVVLAGVGWGVLASSRGIGRPPAICSASNGCTQVMLTNALTHRTVATVILSRGSVWIRPEAIPLDDTAEQIYVLWEIIGHNSPRAVGAFDVVHGAKGPIAVGSIEGGRASVFAVSLEHGRSIPRTPSATIAVGRLT